MKKRVWCSAATWVCEYFGWQWLHLILPAYHGVHCGASLMSNNSHPRSQHMQNIMICHNGTILCRKINVGNGKRSFPFWQLVEMWCIEDSSSSDMHAIQEWSLLQQSTIPRGMQSCIVWCPLFPYPLDITINQTLHLPCLSLEWLHNYGKDQGVWLSNSEGDLVRGTIPPARIYYFRIRVVREDPKFLYQGYKFGVVPE